MVNITLFEVHLEDATFEAIAPFGKAADESQAESENTPATHNEELGGQDESADSDGGPTTILAVVGITLAILGAIVLIKYLIGGDQPAVAIETAEDRE